MEKKKRGRPKRKAGTDEEESVAPAKLQQVCIVHYDASSCDNFTLLAEERFQKIIKIRDFRLSQPTDSTHRMESVCRLIPTEIGEGIVIIATVITVPSQKKSFEKYREK